MKKALVISALSLALVAITPAALGNASGTLTVQASVAAKCTITAATLDFLAYDPVVTNAVAPLDASTTMSVACTKGFNPVITIPLAGRSIAGGGDNLTYELYKDSSGGTVWGETLLTGLAMGAAPDKAPRTLTIFGRIPGGQDVAVASYSGTISVTVNF